MFSLRMLLIPAAAAGVMLLGVSSAGAVAKVANSQPAVSADKAAPTSQISGKVQLIRQGRGGGPRMRGGFRRGGGPVFRGGGRSRMHMGFRGRSRLHRAPRMRRFDGGNLRRFNVKSKRKFHKRRFHKRRHHRRHRYRSHRHYRGWWGPLIIGPSFYYDDYYDDDYYACYRNCRRHHSRRYCKRRWDRYCPY